MSATAYPLRKVLSSNSTASSFTAKIPTATKPAGESVVDVFDMAIGQAVETYLPKYCQVIPFGTDANNETLTMRVWGWSKESTSSGLWIPQLLLEVTVTLGNVDAAAIADDTYMADTLAIAAGDANAAVVSPANDTPGSFLLHLRGIQMIEFDFKTGTAASSNAYWRMMDQD